MASPPSSSSPTALASSSPPSSSSPPATPSVTLVAMIVGMHLATVTVPLDASIATVLEELRKEMRYMRYPDTFTAYFANHNGQWLRYSRLESRAMEDGDVDAAAKYLTPTNALALDPSKTIPECFGSSFVRPDAFTNPTVIHIILKCTPAAEAVFTTSEALLLKHGKKRKLHELRKRIKYEDEVPAQSATLGWWPSLLSLWSASDDCDNKTKDE